MKRCDSCAAEHCAQLVSIPLVPLGDQPHRAAHQQTIEALFYEVFGDREIRMVGRVAQDFREARRVEIAEAVAYLYVNACDAVELRIVLGASDRAGSLSIIWTRSAPNNFAA